MAMATCMKATRAVSARPARAQVKCQASLANVAKAAGLGLVSMGVALAAHADVTIQASNSAGDFIFSPASVTVKSGETVTFVNAGGGTHNAVFDDDANPTGKEIRVQLNALGDSGSVSLGTAGEYDYYCEPHVGAGMAGHITVQ